MKENRRPIKARASKWATGITDALLKRNISPNQISIASVVFALAGASLLIVDNGVMGSIACALFIQLRLLCNLLDGMVAIEGGNNPASAVSTTNFRIAWPTVCSSSGLAMPSVIQTLDGLAPWLQP